MLRKLAYMDGLTELSNRTSFMEDMTALKDAKNGLIAVYDVNYLKHEFVFISTEEEIEKEFLNANNLINKKLKEYDNTSGNPYSTNIAMGYCNITEKRNINVAFEKADASMYKNKIKMKKRKAN